MASPSRQNIDRHILGPETRFECLLGTQNDERVWLTDQPICPLLTQHHIAHLGVMTAQAPFEVVRQNQSGTFMLSCFEGAGLILVDGSWQRLQSGEACLLPPFVQNSLRCEEGQTWSFTWVRYIESPEVTPIVSAHSPVVGKFPSAPLRRVVEGLRSETLASAHPGTSQLWIELLQTYVNQFAHPYQSDNRLWRVWEAVEKDPGHSWTLAQVSTLASVSEEHLRRLCKKELGRSPMQQVTFLRMKKASHLLATTDQKIEAIANQVGYRSAFTFSTTFKNWVGWRPSEHRNR